MGIVLRAAAAYWFLLFIVRIIGRRRTQMTPFELILIFLIGGISVQAVISDERSLTAAFLGIATIGMLHVLVAWLKNHFPTFAKIVDGTPVIIVDQGKIDHHRMSQLRLQQQDLMDAARAEGLTQMEQIRYAIVERSGKISIIRDSSK